MKSFVPVETEVEVCAAQKDQHQKSLGRLEHMGVGALA